MSFSSVSGKNWLFKKFDTTDINKFTENFSLPEVVAKLLSIRKKNYWNYNSLNPKDPVALNLFSQKVLIEAIEKADRRIKKELKEKEKSKGLK